MASYDTSFSHSDNKVYIVTLEDRNDLEGFYSDMTSDGYQLHLKRPISRSTEYYMNSTQAEVYEVILGLLLLNFIQMMIQ